MGKAKWAAVFAVALIGVVATSASAATPTRKVKRCWTEAGQRYCEIVSVVRLSPTPRPRQPPPVFAPTPTPAPSSGYNRRSRQICQLSEYDRRSYPPHYPNSYNAGPKVIIVEDELRKRNMPVCLPGQYPYEW